MDEPARKAVNHTIAGAPLTGFERRYKRACPTCHRPMLGSSRFATVIPTNGAARHEVIRASPAYIPLTSLHHGPAWAKCPIVPVCSIGANEEE